MENFFSTHMNIIFVNFFKFLIFMKIQEFLKIHRKYILLF